MKRKFSIEDFEPWDLVHWHYGRFYRRGRVLRVTDTLLVLTYVRNRQQHDEPTLVYVDAAEVRFVEAIPSPVEDEALGLVCGHAPADSQRQNCDPSQVKAEMASFPPQIEIDQGRGFVLSRWADEDFRATPRRRYLQTCANWLTMAYADKVTPTMTVDEAYAVWQRAVHEFNIQPRWLKQG
jgi:hypothetical protein